MFEKNRKLLFTAGALGMAGAAFAAERLLSARRRTVQHGEVMASALEKKLPAASITDTLRTLLQVVVPTLAKGVIIRRPRVVAMASFMELDRRAVRCLQHLRNKYGKGPLMLCLPLRSQAVVLAPHHVQRVLAESPEPFATASSEKRAALAHFEPKGVLISHGAARAGRRLYNEEILDSTSPVHQMAGDFLPIVEEEAALMLGAVQNRNQLAWDDFAPTWMRIVRRVIFGNSARDDHQLTDMMAELRGAANWAFLRPKKTALQKKFFARIKTYFSRAEPGSLAALMAKVPGTGQTMPHHQVPQWLFAFDAAGIATFRALALLAAHPEYAALVQQEIANSPGMGRQHLPFLRAAVLESVRLWPTTPMILRQTTRETVWETGVMPANTGILIYAPFFHRDDQQLHHADRFAPEIWLGNHAEKDWPLVPFSEGPAVCPGRNLVLLLSSAMLAVILEARQVQLKPQDRLNPERLPGTLNNYSLRFSFK